MISIQLDVLKKKQHTGMNNTESIAQGFFFNRNSFHIIHAKELKCRKKKFTGFRGAFKEFVRYVKQEMPQWAGDIFTKKTLKETRKKQKIPLERYTNTFYQSFLMITSHSRCINCRNGNALLMKGIKSCYLHVITFRTDTNLRWKLEHGGQKRKYVLRSFRKTHKYTIQKDIIIMTGRQHEDVRRRCRTRIGKCPSMKWLKFYK